jgi:GrpB-like predicted nucleotidyltransferase (UPF0157 family)
LLKLSGEIHIPIHMDLDKMSNKELGKLFPIRISEPNPDWISLFRTEKVKIEKALGHKNIIRIEHIGSTAVPDLKAKPTIDILLEIQESTQLEFLRDTLSKLNYHFIPKPENPAPHMMFVKGYTTEGFKGQAYHVHVRYSGDWDELYFRDYLISHPVIAKDYERLKVRLAMQFENDRDGYTEKKTDFITHINKLAKNGK